MPKKLTLPENDTRDSFVVLFHFNGTDHQQEYVGLRNAVIGFRQLRHMYGDNTRLARVIVNYGQEI